MSILLRLDTVDQISSVLVKKLVRDEQPEIETLFNEKYLQLKSNYQLDQNKEALNSLESFDKDLKDIHIKLETKIINKDIPEYLSKLVYEINRLIEIHKKAIELQR